MIEIHFNNIEMNYILPNGCTYLMMAVREGMFSTINVLTPIVTEKNVLFAIHHIS